MMRWCRGRQIVESAKRAGPSHEDVSSGRETVVWAAVDDGAKVSPEDTETCRGSWAEAPAAMALLEDEGRGEGDHWNWTLCGVTM